MYSKEQLNFQKKLIGVFEELEIEKKEAFSKVVATGYGQRNELVKHVYSNYTLHESLNKKREEWEKASLYSKVVNWLYDIFVNHRDLYGYFENPDEMIKEISELLETAVRKEEYMIAEHLKKWLSKIQSKDL
ncbi:hypothetical protein [Jiulongibacter sediminis]|uniref:Uncharacterized protein n=1 Tax=Jiulongibacter sediminis TaxID=1605367 RepID=A0A0P7CB71_9BACT|nr:hypothetical protein [Jiulongibacter sediminis]KPM50022.1 hypothetical protein AFM12_05590 [Jiulongibacter sediminis]TBX27050.1 hypothetical protein TK44_05595 [Jiulongibacter sediminis]